MMLKVLDAPQFKQLTTLRLGGSAIAEVTVGSLKDLEALPAALERLGGMVRVLGRGSNILAHEGVLPLCLVRQRFMTAPDIVGEDNSKVLVKVGAAYSLQRLVMFAARRGLSGLEGLAGIPGEVGGSVAMNAGAMGSELALRLHRLEYFSPQSGLLLAGPDEFSCAYRHFSLYAEKSWWLACHAVLALDKGSPAESMRRVKELLQRKAATQPLQAHSAGCVFKNPPDSGEGPQPAGLLLDKAGLKGKALGGMAFSTRHANFLINTGNGTADQALELISAAREAVAQRFGVALELEIKEWL